MAELIEPFERELRRSRMRLAPSASLQQSFEDDLGRALAEMEARTGNARTYAPLQPGDEAKGIIAREAPRQTQALPISAMIANPVRDPEDPEAVRRELIDPLVSAYGMDRTIPQRPTIQKPPPAPRIVKSGSDVYMEDPMTREFKKVVAGPKTPARLSPQQQSELRVAERELADARRLMNTTPNDRDNVDAYGDAVRRFRRAQQKHSSLVQPAPAQEESIVPPVPAPEAPALDAQGAAFMGAPSGPNQIPTDDYVPVVNPSGKATRIKASDLDRALKQGYKRR